jgi:hypothetical protein
MDADKGKRLLRAKKIASENRLKNKVWLDHGKQLVNYAKFVSILILAGDAYYY